MCIFAAAQIWGELGLNSMQHRYMPVNNYKVTGSGLKAFNGGIKQVFNFSITSWVSVSIGMFSIKWYFAYVA